MTSLPAPAVAAPTAASVLRQRLWAAAPYALIAAGILVRVLRYYANRSLWVDESMLALNILGRSFIGLTEPLSQHQGAPIGFLWLEKLATTVFGSSEYALRLVPLLAGIASLILFYLVARRLFIGPAGRLPLLVALALFAFAEPLLYYSCEVKQYSSDVAMSLLILWLTLRAAPNHDRPTANRDILALTGAIALWFSHAVTFILAGAGTWLFLIAVTQTGPAAARRARDAAVAIVISFLWLLSFAAHYFMSLRGLAADAYLLNYWAGDFLPFPPTSYAELKWYIRTPNYILRDLLQTPLAPQDSYHVPWEIHLVVILAGLAALLGVARLARTVAERRILWLLLLPMGYLAVASALHRYPARHRLVLFLLPLIMLLIAYGIVYVRDEFPRFPHAAWALAAAILWGPVTNAFLNAYDPPGRDELRPVMEYVARHKDQADVAFFLGGSASTARYYMTYYPQTCALGGLRIINGPWEVWDPANAKLDEYAEFCKLTDRKHVWVVFATTWNPWYLMQETRTVTNFDAHARRLDRIRPSGAAAYLYDLNPSFATAPTATSTLSSDGK